MLSFPYRFTEPSSSLILQIHVPAKSMLAIARAAAMGDDARLCFYRFPVGPSIGNIKFLSSLYLSKSDDSSSLIARIPNKTYIVSVRTKTVVNVSCFDIQVARIHKELSIHIEFHLIPFVLQNGGGGVAVGRKSFIPPWLIGDSTNSK